jgi:hypothetical protein
MLIECKRVNGTRREEGGSNSRSNVNVNYE